MSGLTLRTNTAALGARRNMVKTQLAMKTAMERLSSGLRINQAGDDAAGLAISEKLRAQVRSLSQAQRNANDGISLLQVAEGAMGEVSDMLIRMRELSMQSANGSLGATERVSVDNEFQALRAEIDRIAAVTEFNGQNLLDGTLSAGVTFQVGTQNLSSDRISVAMTAADTTSLGLSAGMTLSTVTGARIALGLIDGAVTSVTSRRGELGATQNRLYTSIESIATTHENISAANSRIRDADIAEESTRFSRNQILMQAGVSVLGQANQLPQIALALIG
jgi:flagellin